MPLPIGYQAVYDVSVWKHELERLYERTGSKRACDGCIQKTFHTDRQDSAMPLLAGTV